MNGDETTVFFIGILILSVAIGFLYSPVWGFIVLGGLCVGGSVLSVMFRSIAERKGGS